MAFGHRRTPEERACGKLLGRSARSSYLFENFFEPFPAFGRLGETSARPFVFCGLGQTPDDPFLKRSLLRRGDLTNFFSQLCRQTDADVPCLGQLDQVILACVEEQVRYLRTRHPIYFNIA